MKINSSIFKAYDIRGIYPEELNEEAAFEIAKVLPKILKGKIVVGHDARLSSPTLYKAMLKGLVGGMAARIGNRYRKTAVKRKLYNDTGSDNIQHLTIIDAGLITTPMLYFLVNKLKAGGGIMVTASHNPKEYNGLKVVGKNARPVSGKEILTLIKE